ncbi:MAG: transcription-repair coupling factor [Prevotellaceae bacterium]|nr:transcription-repair coupling factor [Prevotellaceae bacterium]
MINSFETSDFSGIAMAGDKMPVEPETEKDRAKSGLYLPAGLREKEKAADGCAAKAGTGYTDFTDRICSQKGFAELLARFDAGESQINLKNIAGSLKAALSAGLVAKRKGVHLFVFNDSETAAYFYGDLFRLLHPDAGSDDDDPANHRVLFLPSSFKRNSRYGREDSSGIVHRARIMERIASGVETLAVVTFPEAAAETVPSNKALQQKTIRIAAGDRIDPAFLAEMLELQEFERSDFVCEPGQYAMRGYIFDVFSFSSGKPYRIEFFGDEVESTRTFDVNTQFSDARVQAAVVTSNIRRIEEAAEIPLPDFLPKNATVWTEDRKLTADIIDSLSDSLNLAVNDGAARPRLISGKSFAASIAKLRSICFNASSAKNAVKFDSQPQPAFNKKFDLLARDMLARIEAGFLVAILSENANQIERLRNIFASAAKGAVPHFVHVNASLHEGFADAGSRTCCYTDHQIFQRHHRYRIRGETAKSSAITAQELSGLNVGDYVVHIDHGVGVFGGLVKIDVNGRKREMVRIIYADNDTILVNLQGLHRISKFRHSDAAPPKIYKPGSGAWNRLKLTAKKKIKDIAAELIVLYAKRKATPGFACSPDSYLQHELEASFIYEDTPDQLKTTAAVKRDMEQSYPMDRLVCGDVGFGKTEIAIRAAFKAAADGKQVAVLVPTTILALQHYKSFKSRLADFPVNIDFISRMKSSKDIKHSLELLKEGKTEIIVGTHRLLSADVAFKDLGLLIVDEEQRFGVQSKERIRKRRINVDTLTLTATPIPRTLQFSLLGARDLSVINTPPPNRIPITTEVHEFSETIVRDAVEYECKRGGQVFFIHNRIKDIDDMEKLIRRVAPGTKTVVAHGQMEGARLEEIMTDFIDGQYDVLVATTIIESGLDIPNVNTIIINGAHSFGLSELHQLRGRVGRSNRKAYCYLLAPPPILLTSDARRRLKAIEEFSELGSGFGIAMQDLDIRGAGNLLGGEQSGFITEIGFEMYQKILDEAIMELRDETGGEAGTAGEEKTAFIADSHIDSDIEACLPDGYVSNMTEKLRLYREIDGLDDERKVEVFRKELIDRFGKLPREAEELLQAVVLRRLAISLGFERIMIKNGLMFLYFPSSRQSPYYASPIFRKIIQYVHNNPARFKIKENAQKLSLLVREVKSHAEAAKTLFEIMNYEL